MNDTSTQAPRQQTSRPANPSSHPENLGPYRLDELVGEYHGYAVFSATHRKKRQAVTLYLIPSVRGQGLSKFRKDIEAASKLKHRSIASILDFGEIDGIPFVAYEPVEGISIQRLTKLERTIAPPLACAIVRQAAIGLHHVHEHGLLHKGVNPTNLVVTRSGVVKILSLGVASHIVEHPQRPGASENANYCAPEHISGNAEIRSEVYALGCTLFHMLTGETPESSLERSKTRREPNLNEQSLGPQLSAVLRAMMELTPTNRIQQLTQVVGAMCNWASEENLPQLVASHMPESNPPKRSASPTIDKKKAAAANAKDVEFTPPAPAIKRMGPAVAILAVALAIIYAGFWYLNGMQTMTRRTVSVPTPSQDAKIDQPLQTKLAMPHPSSPSSDEAKDGSSEAAAPVAEQPLAASAPDAAHQEASAPDSSNQDDLFAQAKPDVSTEEPNVSAHPQAPAQDVAEVVSEESLRTLPTSVVAEVDNPDRSVDAYHRRLQHQLKEDYGLTNGRWVLTPNEFALISSVVSYGQKVTQDTTTKDEDFARLVRMQVANQGKNPWSSGLYIPEVNGIEKGDRVLVVVWLRTSPEAKNREGKVGIYVESATDHAKEVYLTVKPTPEWRQFLIPFQAKMEQQLRVGFHLAFQAQDIDYGGLTLINFGKTAPFWNAIPAGPKRHDSSE